MGAPHSDPLDTPPPSFTSGEAAALAQRHFGWTGTATALDSERDQNFRIDTDGGDSYLLKISNRADDAGVIEMQTLATLHIAAQDPELPVMTAVPTVRGDHVVSVDGQAVRSFTFLRGSMVEAGELDAPALQRFGATVARTGRALRGFFHPSGGYEIAWDLRNTPDLRSLLPSAPDEEQRALLETVLDRFDELVEPAFPGLRAQMIHNDLTLSNVLLDEDHRVSGIVDFGDLTHSALVCDLAIALVSAMWDTQDPLASAAAVIAGYRSVTTIEPEEAAVLADLVGARLAALILIARSRVERYPENTEYIMGSVPAAGRLLRYLNDLTWPVATEGMRAACLGFGGPLERSSFEDLLDRRLKVLGPAHAPLSYEMPLYLVRGEGSHLFDQEGRAYLDAYNNVPVVGHSHPRVVRAIAAQSAILNTNTRYLHDSVVRLGERLAAMMPEELDTVMFFNSGSEANDIAWRLATSYTGGEGGIVTDFAYHGVTTAIQALSPEEWVAGQRPSHISTVPAPDGFRGLYRADEPGWIERYVAHFDRAQGELEGRGIRPAAIYIDSMFTSDGIFTPPPEYFVRLRERARAAGCLYVADEVQCGYGRTGAHLWGFEASGITPDFVTLGKPMGNGHPVAAVITRSEIAARFAEKTDIFSTFGGNPVACEAALAVLDVIEDEALQRRAAEVGAHLLGRLTDLKARHDAIGDVRGAGLLIGVELVDPSQDRAPASELAATVMNAMRAEGILIGTTGPASNVLKIRPPLVLKVHEADLIANALDACLLIPTREGPATHPGR